MRTSRGLLESARRWCSNEHGFKPTVFDLRGSISLSYYAVFHGLAELCAEELVGKRTEKARTSKAWNEYYRTLTHETIHKACLSSDNDRFSGSIQKFFSWFPVLHGARNLCHYEAIAEPNIEDAHAIFAVATSSLYVIANINESERPDFVAMMMLKREGGVKQIRRRDFEKDTSFFDLSNLILLQDISLEDESKNGKN